jgi:hypothetical protein
MAKQKSAASANAGPSTGPTTTHWTSEETSCFIQYLTLHCAEGGDGTNFKQAAFAAAAAHFLEPPDGILKEDYVAVKRDGLSCKNKWIMVYASLFVRLIKSLTTVVQEKAYHYYQYQITIGLFMGQ